MPEPTLVCMTLALKGGKCRGVRRGPRQKGA